MDKQQILADMNQVQVQNNHSELSLPKRGSLSTGSVKYFIFNLLF